MTRDEWEAQIDAGLVEAQHILDGFAADACTCPSRLGCTVHGPQPRERSATCRRCFRRQTWNLNAVCDPCHEAQALDRAGVQSGSPPIVCPSSSREEVVG